jgi:hypothetical protein
MVTTPEIVWIIFNALTTAATLRPGNENRAISFGLGLGCAALSCALLSSGMHVAFLGMEISLWLLASLVVLLGIAVKPPGDEGLHIGKLALSSGIRLTIALGVWFWS